MKLHLVPAKQGFSWAREGLQTFRQQPLALLGIFMLCIMTVFLLGTLPIIGLVLTQALTPIIGLIMMIATAQVRQGKKLNLPSFIQSLWRGPQHFQILCMIGLTYCALISLILGISTFIDDGIMARVSLGLEKITPEFIHQNPNITHAALFLAAGQALLCIPFWHASALAHWHGLPATKAMFFSCIACIRNMGAFAIYGLSFMAALVLFSIIATVLLFILSIIFPAELASIPIALFIITGSLAMAVIFLGSTVFTFRDCFDAPSKTEIPQNPEHI